MADKDGARGFPRRDPNGRVLNLVELIAVAVVGAIVSFAAVALIDWLMSLVGLGEFGKASGWLAVVLPVLVFVEDFRAWKGTGRGRWLAAAIALALAVGAGMVLAGTLEAPPLVSGAAGAFALSVFYTVLWFIGVRLLTGRLEEGASR